MKKLILILLLVILPFQFSWAAAGAYCQHEKGAASHFGHHLHHHHQAKAESKDTKDELGKVHSDCSSCHGAGCALFIAAVPLDVLPSGSPHVALPLLTYTSHIPDGPRRPDRLPVA